MGPPGDDVSQFGGAERKLRDALVPLQEDILQLIISVVPDAMRFVLDFRADILSAIREESSTSLRYLDSNLRGLLRYWFAGGFLHLQRITWNSPGTLLEKIGAYEKVHPTRRVMDLKTRLGPGRRCFAF